MRELIVATKSGLISFAERNKHAANWSATWGYSKIQKGSSLLSELPFAIHMKISSYSHGCILMRRNNSGKKHLI